MKDLGFLLALRDTWQPKVSRKGRGAIKNGVLPNEVFRVTPGGTNYAVIHFLNGILKWRSLVTTDVTSSVLQKIHSF